MHIVVASSSAHRQALYREAIEGLGHRVSAASGGVECLEHLRHSRPALLVLEAPLLWGGSDGVLDIVQNEQRGNLPVILVAVGAGSIDWFQLSRFRVDDFLFRVPTADELERAIRSTANNVDVAKHRETANKRRGEAGLSPSPPRQTAANAFAGDSHTAWRTADTILPADARRG
jgi:CheY-like chemotaxis protein